MIAFGIIILIIVLVLLSTGIDLWIWNTFITSAFELPALTFWKVFGIALIFAIVRAIIELVIKLIIQAFTKADDVDFKLRF